MRMTPQQHLCFIYKAKVEETGKEITRIAEPTMLSYNDIYSSHDLNVLREKEIAIKMTESEFNRFMQGYENYLTIIYGMQDPIARDMFEKLVMYLELKK